MTPPRSPETPSEPSWVFTNPMIPTSDLSVRDVMRGFPGKSLRPYQEQIIRKTVEAFNSGKRCVIVAAPTGFGKSYVNVAFTSMTHSFYATPQLTLMDQILGNSDLSGRLVEIKGRRNYRCQLAPSRPVNAGKCIIEGIECKDAHNICPYYVQKLKASKSPSVLMSYAYLVNEGQTEGKSKTFLGTRSLLVLDEAHNIEEQTLDQMSIRVGQYSIPYEVYSRLLPSLRKIRTNDELRQFLSSIETTLRQELNHIKAIADATGLSADQAGDVEQIESYLANYQLYKSDWVWHIDRNNELIVQPVFAREFMRDLLWKRADYYIISSATILDPREFIELTGLKDYVGEDKIEFITAPSTFPVENRPVIDATFAVGPLSLDHRQANMPKAINAVEEILRKEPGNVAIHCHSYDMGDALIGGISEEFKSRMITHTRQNRQEKLNEWMYSHPRDKVFVSVAFTEGQDWKYDVCDAQILLKVPFPFWGDERVRKRIELGYRNWYENHTMQECIQAYGRAVRSEDDKARFYVVDGSFSGLVKRCWQLIPDWFKEALPDSFRPVSRQT